MIFETKELSDINFNEVCETSIDTVRKSIDGEKTFVKWDGESIPQSVYNLKTKEGPYTYDEMIELLSYETWTDKEII
jgi:hypothetical protein